MRSRQHSIPGDRLASLETGNIQTATHREQMALSQSALMSNVFPAFSDSALELESGGFIDKLRRGGHILFARLGSEAPAVGISAASDIVRGWGAFSVPHVTRSELEPTVKGLLPYADDSHFAVREWAWLSLRPLVVMDPAGALSALKPYWTVDSPRIRRFCCEATRPRSVWGKHVAEFKTNPALAEEMLRSLASDGDPYVQASVGNWINDVAMPQAGWVRDLCNELALASAAPRVIRRATRRISLTEDLEHL